jgi:hypothetical protein
MVGRDQRVQATTSSIAMPAPADRDVLEHAVGLLADVGQHAAVGLVPPARREEQARPAGT